MRAVLLDADGVVQRTKSDWRTMMAYLIPPDADIDAFMSDFFTAEAPSLVGKGNLEADLERMLSKWNSTASLSKALDVFRMIEPYTDVLAIVRSIRHNRTTCHIASNQNPYRAAYMSRELGYNQLFDSEYYSCHLGCQKPDTAFFQTIMDNLEVSRPDDLIFVDDNVRNVEAAIALGINALYFNSASGTSVLAQYLSEMGVT